MKKKKINIQQNDLVLIVFLALLVTVLAITTPQFLKPANLMRVAQQMSELGIVSLGIMVVILTGGFDMSSSAMIGFTSIVIGVLFQAGMNIWVAIVLAIGIAMFAGFVNGYIVGVLKVAPMLATLGTMTLYQGIALALCKGDAISGFPESFFFIGQKYILGIPVQLIILIVLCVIISIFLNKRPWGRDIYICGSNVTAARFSGIKVEKTIISAYVISAAMAAVSAIVLTSRLATARADGGASYMFEGVAAVMLGGADLSGGYGKVSGTILGVVIFALMGYGLNLNGVSALVKQMLIGLVLIVVLILRQYLEKRKKKA